jgi:alkanesulfonate monooxygenase SsuD/methylene tetrahydromethanopterin reductase-like flavin-dependent oxidoreductase (luciferase family)
MNECLTVLRQLLTGEAGSFHGKFFDLEKAIIAPPAAIPLIIGGRSDAAIRRAGRLGDGWLGIWNSPRRFADAVEMAAERPPASAGSTRRPVTDAGMVRAGRLQGGGPRLAGFLNSATGDDLGFHAARSYSLMRPPRTARRLIRSRERPAGG